MFYYNPSNLFYQPTTSPIHLLQAYLAQISGASTPAPQPLSLPTILQPQSQQRSKQPSKGIKAYPDGWKQVLNGAKDVVRGSVLVKDPFPSSNLAHITVTEAFHEVVASECNVNGLVLEPGMTPPMNLPTILLPLHKK